MAPFDQVGGDEQQGPRLVRCPGSGTPLAKQLDPFFDADWPCQISGQVQLHSVLDIDRGIRRPQGLNQQGRQTAVIDGDRVMAWLESRAIWDIIETAPLEASADWVDG